MSWRWLEMIKQMWRFSRSLWSPPFSSLLWKDPHPSVYKEMVIWGKETPPSPRNQLQINAFFPFYQNKWVLPLVISNQMNLSIWIWVAGKNFPVQLWKELVKQQVCHSFTPFTKETLLGVRKQDREPGLVFLIMSLHKKNGKSPLIHSLSRSPG